MLRTHEMIGLSRLLSQDCNSGVQSWHSLWSHAKCLGIEVPDLPAGKLQVWLRKGLF